MNNETQSIVKSAKDTPFIEMKEVSFFYEDGRSILKNINFSIDHGNFTAIMGSSGSGKTTLLRLITGQITAQSGQVLINGRNIADFSHEELYRHRRNMGVLFQFGALFTDLSVFDNVAFPMREHTDLPDSMIHDLVIMKLNAVGLRGVQKLMPGELSGGMARRVALARTIALDPALLLYDEPFTGLDPISLGVIASLVSEVNHALRSTSVMVTHDIQQSLHIANQVVFLAHGDIIFSGTPEQMYQLDSPWVNQFIHGQVDGPVAFRYPASTTLQQDLDIA